MFGLTFEKLLLIGVIAVFVLGPERLPGYTAKFAQFIRSMRNMANGAKDRMRDEMGPDFDEVDWKKLDPRQYDPRRIIREALTDDSPSTPAVRPVPKTSTRPEAAYLQHKAKSAGGPAAVGGAGAGADGIVGAAAGAVAGAVAGAGVVGAGVVGAGVLGAGLAAGSGAGPNSGADAVAAVDAAGFDDTPFPGETDAAAPGAHGVPTPVPVPEIAAYDSEAT